jgi:hypothetical protein
VPTASAFPHNSKKASKTRRFLKILILLCHPPPLARRSRRPRPLHPLTPHAVRTHPAPPSDCISRRFGTANLQNLVPRFSSLVLSASAGSGGSCLVNQMPSKLAFRKKVGAGGSAPAGLCALALRLSTLFLYCASEQECNNCVSGVRGTAGHTVSASG